MPFYYRYDCIHICRVWYKLFEKQMKYYTLFRVLRWEGVCFSIAVMRELVQTSAVFCPASGKKGPKGP